MPRQSFNKYGQQTSVGLEDGAFLITCYILNSCVCLREGQLLLYKYVQVVSNYCVSSIHFLPDAFQLMDLGENVRPAGSRQMGGRCHSHVATHTPTHTHRLNPHPPDTSSPGGAQSTGGVLRCGRGRVTGRGWPEPRWLDSLGRLDRGLTVLVGPACFK